MPLSGKKIVKLLVKAGWEVVDQKGSHVKLKRLDTSLVVPVHANRDLGRGLIKAIEYQSGLKLL